MSRRGEDLADKLRSIGDELAELSIDLLSRAIESDEPERVSLSNEERRVTRARRAVEKAVALLEEGSD